MMIVRRTQPGYSRTRHGWPSRESGWLRNDTDRLFGNFFTGEFFPKRSVFPLVNLYEDDKNVYLTAELPGIETKDIDISVEKDSIQLKGERKIVSEGENICYHCRERERGRFSKKVGLQAHIDTDNVTAEMNNGVLKVTMPKSEDARPRKIEVRAG
ncbi:Hsp20/alpha crystallin family protein [Desulfococcaceae bacterium HSG8]|nr:Hsp20/alpha crystallin family protein [Desulfococcaceae bacterium HSG8]